MNQDFYKRVKSSIFFGSYPQTKVCDDELIKKLTLLAGELPTHDNSHNWKNYGYYKDGKINDFMFYIDIDINDDDVYEYRGVYFNDYRHIYADKRDSEDEGLQSLNGYYINNLYFFKYELVEWKILKEENSKVLLLSDLVLDSQQFDYDGECINNYQKSTIRKWLNDSFYNTCFNNNEKNLIDITYVDNTVYSTGEKKNEYVCQDTMDKLFLLSYRDISKFFSKNEVLKPNFKSNCYSKAIPSDYALSQGLCQYNDNKCAWLLRSPCAQDITYVFDCLHVMEICAILATDTTEGIRPACVINLKDIEN